MQQAVLVPYPDVNLRELFFESIWHNYALFSASVEACFLLFGLVVD